MTAGQIAAVVQKQGAPDVVGSRPIGDGCPLDDRPNMWEINRRMLIGEGRHRGGHNLEVNCDYQRETPAH